jgi:hypothetical protein
MNLTLPALFDSLEFWRGFGRAVIIAFLIYALLVVVLAELGVPNGLVPRRRSSTSGGGTSEREAVEDESTGEAPTRHATARASSSSEAHREYLDRLRTALKYQGSTVALIVFAVLILGVLRVIDGPEVATILSGIAGFVLGTARGDKASEPSGPALASGANDPGAAGTKQPGSRQGRLPPTPPDQ